MDGYSVVYIGRRGVSRRKEGGGRESSCGARGAAGMVREEEISEWRIHTLRFQ